MVNIKQTIYWKRWQEGAYGDLSEERLREMVGEWSKRSLKEEDGLFPEAPNSTINPLKWKQNLKRKDIISIKYDEMLVKAGNGEASTLVFTNSLSGEYKVVKKEEPSEVEEDPEEPEKTSWVHSPAVQKLNKLLAPTNPEWHQERREVKEDVRMAKRLFEHHQRMTRNNAKWQRTPADERLLQNLIVKYANMDDSHPMWGPLNEFPEFNEYFRIIERKKQREEALDRLVDTELSGVKSEKVIFSPDGKLMWTGEEWIPAPPEN